jgi:hypothetical protein
VSFSGFTVELLLARERIALVGCAGRVELTDEGSIQGALTGRCERGRLGLKFEITETSQTLTLTGPRLPWVKSLLSPTLGTLAELLENPDGKLTLGNDLATGSDSLDNWSLDAKASIDLARIPEDLGLAGLTGKADLSIQAFGVLGKPATIVGSIALPTGATGAATASALRNLNFLLTGSWVNFADGQKPVTFDAIDACVIVTRDQIYFTGGRKGRPAGIFAPGGVRLLAIPSGEDVPILRFLERLDELNRRWKTSHSS